MKNHILENNIGWCDETGNIVIGCDKVSPGCKNCYAETGTIARVLRHRKINPVETWGAKGTRYPVKKFTATVKRLNKLCICDNCHATFPFRYIGGTHVNDISGKFLCNGKLRRIRLFADSNSDWLDDNWPIETLLQFLDAIRTAPNIDFQLLTKRPGNFFNRIAAAMAHLQDTDQDCGRDDEPNGSVFQFCYYWIVKKQPPKNVWFGVSVENQLWANTRREVFRQIPAAIKFVSYEPALEPVDWRGWEFLNWMITGLESGAERRDGGVLCIPQAVEYCQSHGIPIYVKQDCAFHSGEQGRIPNELWALKQFPKVSNL